MGDAFAARPTERAEQLDLPRDTFLHLLVLIKLELVISLDRDHEACGLVDRLTDLGVRSVSKVAQQRILRQVGIVQASWEGRRERPGRGIQ